MPHLRIPPLSVDPECCMSFNRRMTPTCIPVAYPRTRYEPVRATAAINREKYRRAFATDVEQLFARDAGARALGRSTRHLCGDAAPSADPLWITRDQSCQYESWPESASRSLAAVHVISKLCQPLTGNVGGALGRTADVVVGRSLAALCAFGTGSVAINRRSATTAERVGMCSRRSSLQTAAQRQ